VVAVQQNQKSLVVGKVSDHEIVITEEALMSSRKLAWALAKLFGLDEIESSLAAYWSLEVRKAQWRDVLRLPSDQKAKDFRYLEVGCGLGLFVCVGNLLGFNCVGVEPGEEEYQGSVEIAQQILQANGLPNHLIQRGRGEALKFSDNSFDVVCSFQAVEHVGNPELMLREIERVLKPGGMLFLQCSNYLYPYESHYGLILPCPMGKKMTGLCLCLYRRPSYFLAHLNFVTPTILRDWLHAAGFTPFNLSDNPNQDGPELPIEVYPSPFNFTRGVTARRALSFLRFPGIKNVCRLLGVYPQITCVAWKNV